MNCHLHINSIMDGWNNRDEILLKPDAIISSAYKLRVFFYDMHLSSAKGLEFCRVETKRLGRN